MTDKIKRGSEGETLAADFLIRNGYTILERNYRYKKSEIDLIACRDRWLVFVEVKLRTSTAYGFPEEFVDYHKKKMIFHGALHYMVEKDWQGNVRYDIVAIHLLNGKPQIHHLEDAFY